jgi:hypothetical protein
VLNRLYHEQAKPIADLGDRFDDDGMPHLPGPVPVFNVGDATEF